jgi:hypothetical protein
MLVKLLGILDIFIAICFWVFLVFNIFPNKFILVLGIILLVKALIFILGFSVASILDLICALIIIIASSANIPHAVGIITALFLIQKGLFSLAS